MVNLCNIDSKLIFIGYGYIFPIYENFTPNNHIYKEVRPHLGLNVRVG